MPAANIGEVRKLICPKDVAGYSFWVIEYTTLTHTCIYMYIYNIPKLYTLKLGG
jgi:hypothetical protein